MTWLMLFITGVSFIALITLFIIDVIQWEEDSDEDYDEDM